MPDSEQRDAYSRWPYAKGYLLETLDHDLIEQHAREILSRSLNGGRVISFLGAGVSMAYGRVRWSQMVQALVDRIRQDLKAFIESIDPTQTDELPDDFNADNVRGPLSDHQHIFRLFRTLDELKVDGRSLASDRVPMMFQLCEQLDRAISSARAAPTRVDNRNGSSRKTFRERAMELTLDNRGKANLILQKAFQDRDIKARPDVFKINDLQEIYEELRGGIASADKGKGRRLRSVIDAIRRHLNMDRASTAGHESKSARGRAPDAKPAQNQELQPTSWYVFGLVLGLLPKARRGPLKARFAVADKGDGSVDAQPEQSAAPPTGRPVWPARDPLRILRQELGVTRFITTNYDHEIERLFTSDDYRPPGDKAHSLLRPLFRDIVFDPERASDLIAFSASDRTRSASVIHLHGRAENPPDKGKIIVTEADYQKLYLRADDSRDLVDDGIRLAFGGNPLLFVGSNMGEDDILRPLRHFASGNDPFGEEPAVALLPATKKRAERIEEKIALLGRYGVYSIHFGNALLPPSPGSGREPESCEWLTAFWQVKTFCAEALETLERTLKQSSDGSGVAGNGADAVKALQPRLRDILGESDQPAIPGGDGDLPKLFFERKANRTVKRFARPLDIEGISCEQNPGISLSDDLAVVYGILTWLRQVLDSTSPQKTWLEKRQSEDLLTEARALAQALDGAADTILSIFTCAQLERVRRDWDDWKQRWFDPPAQRLPGEARKVKVREPPIEEAPLLLERHAQALSADPSNNPEDGRFFVGAPSATFDALRGALNSPKVIDRFKAARGLRVLLLAGRRGIGKGNFFAALNLPRPGEGKGDGGEVRMTPRLAELLSLMAPSNSTKWCGAALVNLSFSHEIVSVFDRLASFLVESSIPLKSEEDELALRRRFTSLRRNRIERLRLGMEAWAQVAEEGSPQRIAVAINGIGMIFDESGAVKNAQMDALLGVLFNKDFAKAPVDFILVCEDTAIPQRFRGPEVEKNWDLTLLEREDLAARGQVALAAQFERLGYQTPHKTAVWSPDPGRPSLAIHILSEARASVFAAGYFPRIALLLTRWRLTRDPGAARDFKELTKLLNAAREKAGTKKADLYPYIFEPAASGFRTKIRDMLSDVELGKGPFPQAYAVPGLVAVLTLFLELNLDLKKPREFERWFGKIKNELAKVRGARIPASAPVATTTAPADPKAVMREFAGVGVRLIRKQLRLPLLDEKKIEEKLEEEIVALAMAYDQDMKGVHDALGGSRFLITLALAAAYERTTGLTSWKSDLPDLPKRDVERATDLVHETVQRLRLAVQAVEPARRGDLVISEVLEIMRQTHQQPGGKLPIPFELSREASEYHDASPAIHQLMVEVVWHLSVIGQPVEEDVLAICPRVNAACAEVERSLRGTSRDPKLQDHERRGAYDRWVGQALALALNRCLVFRLHPSQRDPQPPADGDARAPAADDSDKVHRFAVHREIQGHVFRKLGAPEFEVANVNQFSLSLYASQPDDLPRLSAEAHRQISDAIMALAGYPDDDGTFGGTLKMETNKERALSARRLRAALGMMRSVYSMGVLSRLAPEAEGDQAYPGRIGCFEQYRRMVRWLLIAAREIEDEASSETSHEVGEAKPTSRFYQEEIVWLYNECGLLSLVEGNLTDAVVMFDAALKCAKELEPDNSCPLHVRIMLNKAVADLERGHGTEARESLRQITLLEHEHPVPKLIAEGYMAVIDHLAGEVTGALQGYKKAIRGLKNLRRSRAVSIFSRHYGDLLRHVRHPDLGPAREAIEDAIHYAQAGGHEDLIHQARLARATLRIAQGDGLEELHAELDAVERYARMVGMPRLSCEVLLIQARVLLGQGEVRRAGVLAAEGLKIATRADLRLRKLSALLLLAEINQRRGRNEAARPLQALGAEMAKVSKAHFALSKAQELEHLLDG